MVKGLLDEEPKLRPKWHLIPSIENELELGGGSGIKVAQRLQRLLLGGPHLGGRHFLGLVILGPPVVVVHVALQCVLCVLSSLSLLIVLTLLFGRLIPGIS